MPIKAMAAVVHHMPQVTSKRYSWYNCLGLHIMQGGGILVTTRALPRISLLGAGSQRDSLPKHPGISSMRSWALGPQSPHLRVFKLPLPRNLLGIRRAARDSAQSQTELNPQLCLVSRRQIVVLLAGALLLLPLMSELTMFTTMKAAWMISWSSRSC